MIPPIDIRPRFVVATTVVVALLMVGSALVELRQSREELYTLLREDALSLAETIDQGGRNAITSMDRLEELLAQRLFDNGYYIAKLDSAGRLRAADLAGIARTNRIYRINIFDRYGRKVMSSHSPTDEHNGAPEKHSPREILAPILQGDTDKLLIGFKEARVEEGQRFAVAIRRTHPAGGAIVLNIDARDLLAFRRSIGIGKLIKDLGDNSGITYAALQDSAGIIAATGSVRELTSFAADTTIRRAVTSRATLTRITPFNGADVFEVIRTFAPDGAGTGVLRIGLAMDEVREAERRMVRRMAIMSIVVVVIGTLVLIFLMAQQNARLMQRRYSAMKTFTGKILTEMGEGVITLDHQGAVTIFNPRAAEILGEEAVHVEGRRVVDIGGDAGARIETMFARPDGTAELTTSGPGGMTRILAVSLSTAHNTTGTVESRTAVIRDLTEARRLEREAQRKEKLVAMGELASGVAHEIRNPLNAMAMIAQRFSREFTPRKGVKEFRTLTQVLHQEARRVNTIIQQFLAFARPPKLKRRRVDVREFVDHVASLFASQASEKGITFRVSSPGDGLADLDHEQLSQALLNLLQNALDATPSGGTIALTTNVVEGRVRMTVADTGTGIPSALIEKIFNLYYTTKSDGNGLGLSITQQIISQHGGTIDVASTVGKGTVFTVDIPAASET
jgi:two-component system, NtrC family, sensor histidine kinase HydH